jgi:hypothetical protein
MDREKAIQRLHEAWAIQCLLCPDMERAMPLELYVQQNLEKLMKGNENAKGSRE